MSIHHSLDISPVPEKVLYINETTIADTTTYNQSKDKLDTMEDDNVRIYVPLDLNQSAILRRLEMTGYRLGKPTVRNEAAYDEEWRKIITQLEIYDQVWCVREANFPNEPDEHWHSRHATELVEKILDLADDWAEKSAAEYFPFENIDALEEEYKITREHSW